MHDDRGERRAGQAPERGWAEIVVIVTFAALIGFAFLWALVLHEKPADDRDEDAQAGTPAVTLTPPTLPPPRKYRIEGGVNLRQGPATNTTVLARLEDGKKVLVECRVDGQAITNSEGSTNLWLRVSLGQFGVGYVSALYVDVGDDIEEPDRIAPCV